MTLLSTIAHAEHDGRQRCFRTKTVASRQLEVSIGTLVAILMVGFVAMISQHPPRAAELSAALRQHKRPAAVRAGVRVVPMRAPQSAVLSQTDRCS